MSTKPRLNVISASTRTGRAGPAIASWFTEIARTESGFDVHHVDLAALNLPFLDEPEAAVEGLPYAHEHTRQWSAMTRAADAFVFVLPEYNRGYPASLKNALDFLYYEWNDKPVAFVSYGMSSGGMRAVEAIKPVVSTLKMMPINEAVTIHLRQTIDEEGALQPTAAMEKAAATLLTELGRVTAAFTAIRPS